MTSTRKSKGKSHEWAKGIVGYVHNLFRTNYKAEQKTSVAHIIAGENSIFERKNSRQYHNYIYLLYRIAKMYLRNEKCFYSALFVDQFIATTT